MKLNSIQFCWWQSRWDFPTFFRLTLKTLRCPFYYSSKCSLLEICLGKCELESCSIKSRSEGFTAYIFQIWNIYSKWWGAAGLFKIWKYGKSEFSDNIRTYQSIKSAPRSGPQPSSLPSSASFVFPLFHMLLLLHLLQELKCWPPPKSLPAGSATTPHPGLDEEGVGLALGRARCQGGSSEGAK